MCISIICLRSHRLGNQILYKNKPRPTIITFLRYVGAKIFENKRKLKGKRISVSESITKTRMEKLQKARQEQFPECLV